MTHHNLPSPHPKKAYLAPLSLGLAFVCEKGFAQSTNFVTGGSETGKQIQDITNSTYSTEVYF